MNCTICCPSLKSGEAVQDGNVQRKKRNEKSSQNKRIVINVSGEIFETYEPTLSRYPKSLLGDSKRMEQFYCFASNQYLFDRLRLCFGSILFFFQSNGILSCPVGIPVNIFEDECKFFGVPERDIYAMKVKEGIIPESKLRPNDYTDIEASAQQVLWRILEIPDSSLSARIFSWFSLSIILVSTIATCTATVTYFDFLPWTTIEYSLNTWFLVELLLRFFAAPNKRMFVRNKMSWVDALAVIPYFLLTLCISEQNFSQIAYLRLFQTVRVVRLIRLSKQSRRLAMVTEIITTSLEDFGMLMSCLSILLVFASSMM